MDEGQAVDIKTEVKEEEPEVEESEFLVPIANKNLTCEVCGTRWSASRKKEYQAHVSNKICAVMEGEISCPQCDRKVLNLDRHWPKCPKLNADVCTNCHGKFKEDEFEKHFEICRNKIIYPVLSCLYCNMNTIQVFWKFKNHVNQCIGLKQKLQITTLKGQLTPTIIKKIKSILFGKYFGNYANV